jgi:glyoxylase-like metal-dependent hydrolase (beta-lactamase superfamily II)
MQFWNRMETGRFHDYAQESTKVPVQSMPIARSVSEGDTLEEAAVRIRVISTPGYTRGAVSYLIETGGKRIACTGDLIYGDGQLFDLYSLQDAVPKAKARGYHGYAARAGDLIASLRKVAATRPDIILPARGPAITDPVSSINKLIARLQTFLASHFEVDALRWYWGDENHRIRSKAVEQAMDVMPMAEQGKLPNDIIAIGNSRLILSRTGAAFLVDAGYRQLLPELQRLREAGKIKSVDGIWITHYHDDHTDYVKDVIAEFRSPVYFTARMAEVLGKPGAFRLPCLPTRPVPVSGAKRDGETLRWNEWQFTFWDFPGQTLYHGGLVAKRDDGQTFLFTGDSFTPSGMDDYCMQNRDFLRAAEGYEFCLRRISTLPENAWLINQHVEPLFRYSGAQVSRMQRELAKRSATLKQLSPWPDINYSIDESWARIHPYGSEVRAG